VIAPQKHRLFAPREIIMKIVIKPLKLPLEKYLLMVENISGLTSPIPMAAEPILVKRSGAVSALI
jgi:hypothetical protein